MLTVSSLMTTEPYTVYPEAAIREVLMLMKTKHVRQIPVVDAHKRLLGIVTDRDIRLAINSPFVGEHWLDNSVLDNITVQSCMTTTPLIVSPQTPAYEAAEILSAHKFGALPVVDDGKVVGIITTTDFLDFSTLTLKKEAAVPA